MKRYLKLFTALLVCGVVNQSALYASSHREAPLITADPLADNTDVYAFRSPSDSSKIVLIADYIPFEHPAGGPNWYTFGENIRYEIHVKNQAGTTGDDITYRFTFKTVNQDPTTFFNIRLGAQNQKTTYTLEKGNNAGIFTTIITNGIVPANNIGPRSIENPVLGLNVPNYDTLMNRAIMQTPTATGGEKVFAGPIDDPFFVDLGGAFDLGGFRKTGRDGLAKMNCHSLVIEVPISTLHKNGKTTAQAVNILDSSFVIGVYASASRQTMSTFDSTGGPSTPAGSWVQVSRLGMPLTNEAVIPIGMKDKWNGTATNSSDELSFAKYFTNPELALYMDNARFGGAVPGLADLRIQTKSLATAADPKGFDFQNDSIGLYKLKGNPALVGTAFDPATYGNILLPDNHSPRSVDILPIFYTGVPNLAPYQLATGKPVGSPLSPGKPFINNFLPTLGDMLRLNMAVPVTSRTDPKFSTLGLVYAAVLGLTDTLYNKSTALQNIPNMDGFPNGRRLEDDVTTIELQAVSGVVLAAIGLWYDDYTPGVTTSPVTAQLGKVLGFNAGITKNDTTLKSSFPYVQGPWRGFTGASFVGPVNPITAAIPTAFTTCPTTNIAIARPGYNAYNGEPITMYNLDTTTGKATAITGGPLKVQYTNTNMDVNGAGLNGTDGFVYAISDTGKSFSTINANAFLYRIGSNYSNYPVGLLPPPPTSAGQTAIINSAAGCFDEFGTYYYTATVGTATSNTSFQPSAFYLMSIPNVSTLSQGTGMLTATAKLINSGCGFFAVLGFPTTSTSGNGAGIQDITYSRSRRSIYLYEAFTYNNTDYQSQLIGINPSTGVTTCYPLTNPAPAGASNNEVSGISTTTNGSLLIFYTSGDMYKANLQSDGTYSGSIVKLGASGIPALGVTGSIRGDLASCGFGPTTLPLANTVSGGALPVLGSIVAYPNPARGITTISLTQAVSNATVRVLSMTGNILSEKAGISGTTFTVDMTNKPSGLYMIEVLQGGSVIKAKVIKQ